MTNDTNVPHVEIYTTPICGFCMRAKSLLKQKGIEFDEINVMMSGAKREEMMQRSNGEYTVPQIFIDGDHIGGCDDLFLLEHRGELDAKLRRA